MNTRRAIILSIIGVLLLIPLIGMQFTNEVNWTAFDFIIAGLLLAALGLSIEIVTLKMKNKTNRALLISLVLLIGILIWLELAVGLFGSPFAGN